MSRVGLILLFILQVSVVNAQKISDTYFLHRQEYWKALKKKTVPPNNTKSQIEGATRWNNLIASAAKNEYKLLKRVFLDYNKKYRINLDTAQMLYILSIRPGGTLIWTKTDTIYVKNADRFLTDFKSLNKIEYATLNQVDPYRKKYIGNVMNMISETPKSGVEDLIKSRTLNKDGTQRLVLDGYGFEAYIFSKINRTYEVNPYFFRNPRME